jgi:hypothetical protein
MNSLSRRCLWLSATGDELFLPAFAGLIYPHPVVIRRLVMVSLAIISSPLEVEEALASTVRGFFFVRYLLSRLPGEIL